MNFTRHPVKTISSASNKTFKEFFSLLSGRGMKRHGKTIISGSKIVPEIIEQKPELCLGWITPPNGVEPPHGFPYYVNQYRLSSPLFRELDVNGTGKPLLLISVPEMNDFDEDTFKENIVLLIPFQDPLNVGAAVRTAAAFGVREIVLLKEAANPYHQKSIRAAGTALINVHFMKGPSIEDLSEFALPIVALNSPGENIRNFPFPDRFALLPGIEGTGIPDNLIADHTVSISIDPSVESLNAVIATSIALFEWKNGAVDVTL